MKLSKLFFMAAMGLGLVACTENDLVEGGDSNGAQNEGTTYVGFSLKFNASNTRATTTGEEEGTSAEQNIKTAFVMMADASGNVEQIVSIADAEKGTGTSNTNTDYYVFQTTAGVHYFYAVVNPDIAPTMEGDNATAKTISTYFKTGVALTVASITSTADGGNFMMASHEVLTANVEDGVTEDEALQGTKNCFAIQVERATAKVTMTCENTTLTSATNNGSDGKITTPKFTLKGGATKSYRMAQSAINEITGNVWTYTSNAAGTEVYVKDGEETDLHKKATPVYCLENIHNTGDYLQTNTTYLNLQTNFVPAKVVNCDATAENGELKVNPNAEESKAVSFYVVNTGNLAGNYILKSELEAFQKGEVTKFPKGVESISAEYVNGTCWFGPIWIGQGNDQDSDGPVYRNTWYNLAITGIKLPGDPNQPEPGGGGLTPATNVAITLSVMPWNFIGRDIELQ